MNPRDSAMDDAGGLKDSRIVSVEVVVAEPLASYPRRCARRRCPASCISTSCREDGMNLNAALENMDGMSVGFPTMSAIGTKGVKGMLHAMGKGVLCGIICMRRGAHRTRNAVTAEV